MKGFYRFLMNTFNINLSELKKSTNKYTKTMEDTVEYLEKGSNSIRSFERQIIRQLSDTYDDANRCTIHVKELKERLHQLSDILDDVEKNVNDLNRVFKK